MSLREAVELYSKLTGKDGTQESIVRIGAYLDGYEKGKEDAEPHWIPVTERLPKEDGNYLVSGKWGSGKESVGDCEFSVEDGYFQTAWNFDVLAWRKLPEPFKGVTT